MSIARRWRVLTRLHLRSLVDLDVYARHYTRDLATKLAHVLLYCGVEGTDRSTRDSLLDEFRLGDIVKVALQFHEATGVKYVSRDFSLWVYRPGNVFDEASMEDDRTELCEDPRGTSQKTVLCTTQFGLAADSPSTDPDTRAQLHLVLKPKVILFPATQTRRSPA